MNHPTFRYLIGKKIVGLKNSRPKIYSLSADFFTALYLRTYKRKFFAPAGLKNIQDAHTLFIRTSKFWLRMYIPTIKSPYRIPSIFIV